MEPTQDNPPVPQELGERGSGLFSRSQSFNQGTGGNPVVSSPASLQDAQRRANMQIPVAFTPSSPLHQIIHSPNGSSAVDAQRQLIGGGQLPTANGMASNTYEQRRPFMSPTMNV